MAGKAGIESEYSDKDTLFVGRFVYDVLEYTLTKCGLPRSKFLDMNCEANVYNRSNFVKIAGASTLRLSLLMREKWRQLFISERDSFVSNSQDIVIFLGTLATSCSLSRGKTIQSAVEILLASCNEVFLLLHYEGIRMDDIKLMKSISAYILLLNGQAKSKVKKNLKIQNISEKIEGLFDEFDNVSGYTRWITNFIKKYAIPYGSRDDVSSLFLERVKRQFLDIKKASPPGTSSISIVEDHFGYLPLDLCSDITDEKSVSLPGNLVSATGSTSQDSSKSLEPAKLPCTSDSGALERRPTGSDDVSDQTTKREQSSKNSSELGIEDDLEQMSLNAEAASEISRGAIPKRKNSKKKRNKN